MADRTLKNGLVGNAIFYFIMGLTLVVAYL